MGKGNKQDIINNLNILVIYYKQERDGIHRRTGLSKCYKISQYSRHG